MQPSMTDNVRLTNTMIINQLRNSLEQSQSMAEMYREQVALGWPLLIVNVITSEYLMLVCDCVSIFTR